MTGIRLEDLPPAVRARVEAELGQPRHRKSRAGVGNTAPCPGHCNCGHAYPTYTAWEHHAQATGHTRWAIDLEVIV